MTSTLLQRVAAPHVARTLPAAPVDPLQRHALVDPLTRPLSAGRPAQRQPIQRAELELKAKDKGEQSLKEWVSAWQDASIEAAMKMFFEDVFEKALFTDRITSSQRKAIEENYQELIFNSLDQALRLHLADAENVGLGVRFGAQIVKVSENTKTWVELRIWDNGGGFPPDNTGLQEHPGHDLVAKERDPESLYLGGLGIGTKRMIAKVMDAGGKVAFLNKDFGNGLGATVLVRYPYLKDE